MNHKWESVESTDKYIKKDECTVCGCIRYTQTIKDGSFYREMIDCIDWNDNSKTID